MNYLSMLDRLNWKLKSKDDLDRLEKILLNYKKAVLSTQDASYSDEFTAFWNEVINRNVYIASLLYTRIKNLFGKDDECAMCGKAAIIQKLKETTIDDNYQWNLLAQIEGGDFYNTNALIVYALRKDALSKCLGYLVYSSKFPNNVVRFLKASISFNFDVNHNITAELKSLEWKIDIDDIKYKDALNTVILDLFEKKDIISLSNLAYLFDGLNFIEASNKSIEDWKALLTVGCGYTQFLLLTQVLESANMDVETRLNELYSITPWANDTIKNKLNCFLFFAYAISHFPSKFDYYASFFKGSPLSSDACYDMGSISVSSSRYLNNIIIDKPFIALAENNPDKAAQFLDIMGEISLYHYSKNNTYRKWTSWIKENQNNLNRYKIYTDYICENYDADKALHIYMNSPLKSMIDFTYVLRKLFMKDTGWQYLTPYLDKYTFRGKLIKDKSKNDDIAYSVSVSSVSSTYVFPIHHTWVTPNKENLENNFSNDDVVYFKLLSMNSHGMIFAYDLSTKVLDTPTQKSTDTVSYAFKHLMKAIQQNVKLQADNTEESVRMYTVAMVCNDTTIMVEKGKHNNKDAAFLPCLPISNYETSNATLKRILKYHTGFNKDVIFTPCGIRHICVGREKRSIIYIYKINLSDIRNEQSIIALNKNVEFVKLCDFKNNISDEVTRSIVDAMNTSWSEYIIRM